MKSTDFIRLISKEVRELSNPIRCESATFLVWFLINYFKLDEETALSLVCDSVNDKGVDGIFVDDFNEEIYIFQSKFSPNAGAGQGDNDLRNFSGSKNWFNNRENVDKLDNSIASNELKSLIKRVNVFNAMDEKYDVYQVFITNRVFDQNAVDYLGVAGDQFIAYDLTRLNNEYIFTGGGLSVQDSYNFNYQPNNIIEGKINNIFDYYFIPVKVQEIVKLKGIQDKTLFAKNVRYGLGRTRVNREIKKTLEKKEEHQNVILYHNGLTLIAENVDRKNNTIQVTNYSIVNGCQSTITFYENQSLLTPKLEVLLRIIETGQDKRLSDMVTYYTNNQNAISLKDLKSNDRHQQEIQTQFFEIFQNKILYSIKSGEDTSKYQEIIPNDFASQLITSFYLKTPSLTHQKTQNFTDNYNQIFDRNVDAYYIYLLNQMYKAIDSKINEIDHLGIRSYKITRFFFMYLFRLIFEKDKVGNEFITSPKAFYEKYKKKNLIDAFGKLFCLVAPDFNFLIAEIEKTEGFFDYKNELRNNDRVNDIAGKLIKEYLKSVNRHQEDSFTSIISSVR